MKKFKPDYSVPQIHLESGSKRDQLAFLADIPCRSFSFVRRPEGESFLFDVTTVLGGTLRSYQLTVFPPFPYKRFYFSWRDLNALKNYHCKLCVLDFFPNTKTE